MTMMRCIVGAAATILFVGLPAGESVASTGNCQDACSDARKNCMSSKRMAHRSCRSGCRESINEAVSSARAICGQQGLAERACRKLVHRTVHGAQKACRADCGADAKLAKTVCKDERRECAQVCSDEIDPACRDACVDNFQACRKELGACVDVCKDERRAAVEACHDQVAGVCDPEALRECLRQARAEFRSCASECHGETTCAQDLRECVGDCLEEPDYGGEKAPAGS